MRRCLAEEFRVPVQVAAARGRFERHHHFADYLVLAVLKGVDGRGHSRQTRFERCQVIHNDVDIVMARAVIGTQLRDVAHRRTDVRADMAVT